MQRLTGYTYYHLIYKSLKIKTMTTTVKMQQIKENANQCEMTILEYVKEAMAVEGDQFAKWFFDDDTAELNSETESQILNELGF